MPRSRSAAIQVLAACVVLGGCARAPSPRASLPAAPPVTAPAALAPPAEAVPKPMQPPSDLNAPFATENPRLLRDSPYRPADFGRADATFSGSIHSPLPAGVFFKHPDFQKQEHDGRLYFIRFLNREGGGSFGFITWTPLEAKTEMAQRAVPIPNHSLQDFETDGKVLRALHYPPWPQKKPILVQEYHWKGDETGHGRFTLAATRKGEIASW